MGVIKCALPARKHEHTEGGNGVELDPGCSGKESRQRTRSVPRIWDSVKEFSPSSSFMGNYLHLPLGLWQHLWVFFLVTLCCSPTIYFHILSRWLCPYLGWLSYCCTFYVNLKLRGSYPSSETNLLCKETSTYLLTALKLFKPDVSKLFCKKGLNSMFNYAPWSRS